MATRKELASIFEKELAKTKLFNQGNEEACIDETLLKSDVRLLSYVCYRNNIPYASLLRCVQKFDKVRATGSGLGSLFTEEARETFGYFFSTIRMSTLRALYCCLNGAVKSQLTQGNNNYENKICLYSGVDDFIPTFCCLYLDFMSGGENKGIDVHVIRKLFSDMSEPKREQLLNHVRRVVLYDNFRYNENTKTFDINFLDLLEAVVEADGEQLLYSIIAKDFGCDAKDVWDYVREEYEGKYYFLITDDDNKFYSSTANAIAEYSHIIAEEIENNIDYDIIQERLGYSIIRYKGKYQYLFRHDG